MSKPPIKIYGSAGEVANKGATFQAKALAQQEGQKRNSFSGDMPPIKIYGSAGEVANKGATFQAKALAHQEGQRSNPFSGDWKSSPKRLSLDDPRYGRPPEGSKTEKRGKEAGCHISNEVRLLCDLISEHGTLMEDGTTVIPFGELFAMYTRISNKVVGMLLRARKHGLLDFEGEMLYQRRDDNVPIVLLRPIEVLRAEFEKGGGLGDS